MEKISRALCNSLALEIPFDNLRPELGRVAGRPGPGHGCVELFFQQTSGGAFGGRRVVRKHDQGGRGTRGAGFEVDHLPGQLDLFGGRVQAFHRGEIPVDVWLQALQRAEVPLRVAENDVVQPQRAGALQAEEETHVAGAVGEVALRERVVVGAGAHRGPGKFVDRPVVGKGVALVGGVDETPADRVHGGWVQRFFFSIEKKHPDRYGIAQAAAQAAPVAVHVFQPDIVGEIVVARDHGDEVAHHPFGFVQIAGGFAMDLDGTAAVTNVIFRSP